jgi:ankyrin repeat protein
VRFRDPLPRAHPTLRFCCSGCSAVHCAVQSSNADLLQFLLKDCGLDATIPDGLGRTGTHIASSMGSLHMLQCLHANMQLSFSPDENSCYPLHLVARNGSVDCAKVLLACGHPPHVTDSHGCSPLHLACTEHNLAVIQVLAEASRVDGHDITGASPLMICVEKGMLDAIETLLKFGASAAHRDFFGRSCLHAALNMAHDAKQQAIVTMLIKGGCDVNARDTMGRSPCFIAAEKGNMDMLKLLMDHGGDVAVADSSGKTCLALLSRDNFQVVTQLLIERLVPLSYQQVRDVSCSSLLHIACDSFQPFLHAAVEDGNVLCVVRTFCCPCLQYQPYCISTMQLLFL